MNKVDFNNIVGCDETDAINYIVNKTENTYRTVYRDGKYFIITRDFVTSRINLKIENGFVVDAYFG